jgi:hypothetical protein
MHDRSNMKGILTISFLLFFVVTAHRAHAQQEPIQPTSATDGHVKIQRHPKVRNLRHDNRDRGRKLPGESRVFKRLGGINRKEMSARAPRSRTEATPADRNTHSESKSKRFAPSPRDNHATSRKLPRNRHRAKH